MMSKSIVSIAPMMDWTDRHYRFFMRQITKQTMLYTEMVTTGAILHGDKERLLGYSPVEKPLVLQLGGDNPQSLAECAKIAEALGYDEINLNVGCPSDRVQNGNFGACLMAKPELVGTCIETMQKAVKIPVTVKNRIGIDGKESYEDLVNFVKIVSESGCKKFIIHARIAILNGLSPKGNRTVPPLRYNDVYNLKKAFPHLIIEINGGIKTIEEIEEHLKFTDGVMIGREAYDNPYLFATFDQKFYASKEKIPTRKDIILSMIPYVEDFLDKGVATNRTLIHTLGLFNNKQGSKLWRRYLSENINKKGTNSKILLELLEQLPTEVLEENFIP